jgi:hypothetical protein
MKKNNKNRIILVWFTLTLALCAFSALAGSNNYVKDSVQAQGIQEASSSGTIATSAPKPVVLDPIRQEIKDVFGDDYPKAMLLLTGTQCHENLTLNPKAVNDNSEWGGLGRDRGIFQISDYYHPNVTDAEAFDYKFNIEYAHRMFVNDGYTFSKRWTCGQVYKNLGYNI